MAKILNCIPAGCSLLLVVLAAGGVGAQVTDHVTEGNLESTHDIGCAQPGRLSNSYTPADLYQGLAECIEERRYEDGVLLFALAGVYGRFDTFRVADRSAHQAVTVLRMNHFDTLKESRKQRFAELLKESMEDPEELNRLCNLIRGINAPSYFPRYMVEHGLNAFRGDLSNEGLVEDFDVEAAWESALDSYLHCPGLETEVTEPSAPPMDGLRRR